MKTVVWKSSRKRGDSPWLVFAQGGVLREFKKRGLRGLCVVVREVSAEGDSCVYTLGVADQVTVFSGLRAISAQAATWDEAYAFFPGIAREEVRMFFWATRLRVAQKYDNIAQKLALLDRVCAPSTRPATPRSRGGIGFAKKLSTHDTVGDKYCPMVLKTNNGVVAWRDEAKDGIVYETVVPSTPGGCEPPDPWDLFVRDQDARRAREIECPVYAWDGPGVNGDAFVLLPSHEDRVENAWPDLMEVFPYDPSTPEVCLGRIVAKFFVEVYRAPAGCENNDLVRSVWSDLFGYEAKAYVLRDGYLYVLREHKPLPTIDALIEAIAARVKNLEEERKALVRRYEPPDTPYKNI